MWSACLVRRPSSRMERAMWSACSTMSRRQWWLERTRRKARGVASRPGLSRQVPQAPSRPSPLRRSLLRPGPCDAVAELIERESSRRQARVAKLRPSPNHTLERGGRLEPQSRSWGEVTCRLVLFSVLHVVTDAREPPRTSRSRRATTPDEFRLIALAAPYPNKDSRGPFVRQEIVASVALMTTHPQPIQRPDR
jgi:hypothetical protein